MTKVELALKRIVHWFSANIPEDEIPRLFPPASTEDFASAEATLDVKLPRDVRSFYLLHNGSAAGLFPNGPSMMPLDDVLWNWKMMCDGLIEGDFPEETEPTGPIRPVWWNVKWVPVTNSGSGDYFCVDRAPAKGGRSGQLIAFDHEVGPVRVVARSFGDYLTQYADDLEAGKYYYDPRALTVYELSRKRGKS